ncbi:hypothetical protein TNCV_2029721 [Trichonephila clavipes]|nr:hypothetical protein TNCV_2029721 [Trichonephila clavipes]
MSEEKVHLRHCMWFEFQKGNDVTKAKRNLCDVSGEEAVIVQICQKFLVKFCLQKKFNGQNFDMFFKSCLSQKGAVFWTTWWLEIKSVQTRGLKRVYVYNGDTPPPTSKADMYQKKVVLLVRQQGYSAL